MNDRVVLCYHAISADWPADLAVSAERLREQVSLLLARGYRAVTFEQIVRDEASGKLLAITFDDGYRSVLERALPVLDGLGAVATIFVPTDFIGSSTPMSWPGIDGWTPGPYADELLPLSWEQLDRLASAGWEIGSHTASHPHLTELDDGALAAELVRSRDACERHLGVCATIAYPFGESDERVHDAARDAGYEAATILGPGPPRTFAWPRVGVYPVDDLRRFRIKVARPVRRLRATGGARLTERLRSRR